jgi:alkylhydroperoxidase/carboxymuconolactone decarboxylase family protein YurZ
MEEREWGYYTEAEIAGNPALDRLAKTGHPRRKWIEMLAEYQPEALEAFDKYQLNIHATTAEVDPKTLEFVIIAIDIADDWLHTANHMNLAFEKGATVQELVDVCVITNMIKGPHALHSGLSALDECIRHRRAHDLPVPRDKSELGSG